MPDNRQWAGFIWLLIIAAFVLMRHDLRRRTADGARQLFEPKILLPLLLFTAYCAGVIWAGDALGGWTPARITDTVVWFGGAVALLFRATEVAKERQFIRHSVIEPVRVAAIVVFIVGLYPFALWAELLLVPTVVFAVSGSAVASQRCEYAPPGRLTDLLLTTGGFALLGWAIYRTIENWGMLRSPDTIRALLLPMWATTAVVPMVYLFSVLMEYEKVAQKLGMSRRDTWQALAAAASVLRLRVRDVAALNMNPYWSTRVAEAGSFEAARMVTAEFSESLRNRELDQRRRDERLRVYAGVSGTDEDGRQLDQREFNQTRRALQWLATVQMGCYHNHSRYQAEALDRADLSRFGLPAEHGVHMKVRDDGRAWYAWRRTPSGWCFGLGAIAPPPDQWLSDGPKPPNGFPGNDPWWGSGPFGADAENW